MTREKPGTTQVKQHYLRDVDCTQLLLTPERSVVLSPLTEATRSPVGGGAGIGLVTTVFDIGASDPAMAVCPADWVATQQVAVHGSAPILQGPIVIDSRVERLGKKAVTVTGTIWDACGLDDPVAVAAAIDDAEHGSSASPLVRAGTGLIGFARMTRNAAPHMGDYVPADWIGQVRTSQRVTTAPSTLHERMGIRVIDAGTGRVEIDATPYVVNAIGTVNGGSQAAVIEIAAEAAQPGLVATDLQLHFLAQVRVGPLRSAVSVVREARDHSVVSVRLVDAGSDDHLVSLATVTLQRPA